MTKTQQRLERQATTFVNSGGKALSAILRLLLLGIAVLFEFMILVFSRIEESLADNPNETEHASKRNEGHTFIMGPDSDERTVSVVPRSGAFAHEHATVFTGTGGSISGLPRRK
jgi:hypothetical protein